MALFTQLAPHDVEELARVFDLGTVTGFEAIVAGTINSNFSVVTTEGRWFVRVNEGKSEADVAWEAQLVEALASHGVVTPPPLRADSRATGRDGKPYAPFGDKWVSVFPWRAGVHQQASEVTAESALIVGAELARLHDVGLALPTEWRRGSIYDHAHLVARYDRFKHSTDPELARAIAILGEELALPPQPALAGIIHGDLFRDNVLWERGRITAILDFEQASGGSLAYDLAVCINDWCWDGGPRIDLVAALVDGYHQVRPIDRAALPIEVRRAAARFTITRITDVYLANQPNPEKDFRAFLARCEAWRGPALGQLTAVL